MKIIKLCVILVITLFLQGCPDKTGDPNMYVKIKNESENKIHIVYTMTNAIISANEFVSGPYEEIMKNEEFQLPCNTSFFDDRKLGILIFNQQTIINHSWEEIQEKNLYDKRYVLSLEELKAMNYTVVYDGK